MKKFLAIFLAMLMVLTLTVGCSSNEAEEPDNSGEQQTEDPGTENGSSGGESAKVACLFRISDMYAAWLKAAFEAEATKYDNVELTVFDNQDDSAKHIELMENCILQGYDYIVVQGRQGDLESVYQRAIDAGIKMIQINYAEEWSYDILPSILCDEYELGYAIANRAAEELPENAQVCILNGPAGNYVSEGRREGFQAGLLDARPDVTLLDEQDANFQKDLAMNKTSDWLQMYDQIDGIICASDSEAVGAIEAYSAANVDISNTLIYGIDGLTEACTAILDGTMSASALQDATEFSRIALEMITQDMAGEIDLFEMVGSEEAAVTTFLPTLIDSSNAQEQYDFYVEQGMVQ